MSYSDVTGHHSMVFDSVRNAAYARALAKVVTPNTTVMDLGAGLGVHGLNAAKLGAKAVHLVEPAPVLDALKQVAKDNGLANMHFHQCRAEELALDTKVDVLVSVFTGNFLLTEDLLPSLFHARDKFLAPGGSMVPDRARMEVVPVSAPDYYAKHVDRWRDSAEYFGEHGNPELDYRAVRAYAANTMFYDRRKKFDATPLATPGEIMALDFTTATSAGCDCKTQITAEKNGSCHGWLGWFQMRLGDEWLSTSGEPEDTHWSPVFLPLETPIEIKAGAQMGFALKRPEWGEWTWTTEHAGKRQRQSTFLSQPLSPERLRKVSQHYQPKINRRGEAASWLLQQMSGDTAVSQLSKQAQERYPDVFPDHADAQALAKSLAEKFS